MNEHKESAGRKASRTHTTCQRCDGDLGAEGFCTDHTCPFSDHKQDDQRGWAGHPERDRAAA